MVAGRESGPHSLASLGCRLLTQFKGPWLTSRVPPTLLRLVLTTSVVRSWGSGIHSLALDPDVSSVSHSEQLAFQMLSDPRATRAHALLQYPKRDCQDPTAHGTKPRAAGEDACCRSTRLDVKTQLTERRKREWQAATRAASVYFFKDLFAFCGILHSANIIHVDFLL